MPAHSVPADVKKRLLRRALPDIEDGLRMWAESSRQGITVTGVGIGAAYLDQLELLVFLTHDELSGVRLLEYGIPDHSFHHDPLDVGRDLDVALFELSVAALRTLPRLW